MEAVIISPISDQLTELISAFSGLSLVCDDQSDITKVKGQLAFMASSKDLDAINDCFDIEIYIPSNYPSKLPVVKVVSERIKEAWGHINPDGTLCLALPTDQRRTFNQQPTLLGFTDNLVIPYLYGYCYWEKHGSFPFGEAQHGAQGIMDHYKLLFSSDNEASIIRGLYRAHQYGYRGHHPCPCGSGFIVRQCHKDIVWEIAMGQAKSELLLELNTIFLERSPHIFTECDSSILEPSS